MHAPNTVHAMRCSHQRPLVKPDVRNYRLRLCDDPSATGIGKELTALISQVDKPLGLQCLILRSTAKLLTVPLAPRCQKATPPFLHKPVDLSEGHARIPEAKVIPPAPEKTIHLGDEFLRRWLDLPLGHQTQPCPHSIHRLGRRHYVKIAPVAVFTPVESKSKAQKIKAFTGQPQVNHTCLVLVQTQPQRPSTPLT